MYQLQVKNARAVEDAAVGMSSHFTQMQVACSQLTTSAGFNCTFLNTTRRHNAFQY